MGYAGAIGAGMQAVTGLAGSYADAQAMKAKGAYESNQADINARMSGMQAEDALKRGETAANAARRKGLQVAGSKRAALGASGQDVNSGTAASMIDDAKMYSELDALTLKTNAAKEAFGHRIEAENYGSKGRMAGITAKWGARNTMLTGGMNFLSMGGQSAGKAYGAS